MEPHFELLMEIVDHSGYLWDILLSCVQPSHCLSHAEQPPGQ